jgi:hypothetical protein
MKLRSLILIATVVAVTVTSLSGCVVVPARGYYGPPPVYHGGWGYYGR